MTSPSSREGDRIGQGWFLAEACCDSMTAYFGWETSFGQVSVYAETVFQAIDKKYLRHGRRKLTRRGRPPFPPARLSRNKSFQDLRGAGAMASSRVSGRSSRY